MKVKVSVELAEDKGWIPDIDCFTRGTYLGMPTSKIVSNDEYLFREKRRNMKYGVDANGMVEVDI